MTGLHPLSRRSFLALGGAGTLAVALSACGRGHGVDATQIEGPPSGVAAAAPGPGGVDRGRPGGSVVTAWTAEGNSYDAALGYDLHSWEAITSLLYQPLYQFRGENGPSAPAAAAAMPEISADGTRYVIRLKPGVKFHNGRPVVARDYIYAWRRVLDPATESWAQQYFTQIKGAADFAAGNGTDIPGLSALDDHTLLVELDQPDIAFIGQLSQPYSAALPKEEVDRLGEGFGRTPVGNGPFMITSYDSKNQRSTFVRNPHYQYPGLPFLDQVVYRWGLDPALQYLQLRNGDVDILGEGLTPSIAARVQGNSEIRDAFTVPIRTLGASWVAINTAKITDPRIRQALNLATDRTQLAKYARGLNTAWGAVIPADEPDYRRTATPYGYDQARARELMKAAGAESLNLEFLCNEDDYWLNASQVLQQQWAAIGVNVKVNRVSNAAYWTALENGEADVSGRNYYQVQPTGLDLVSDNFGTGAASNYQSYSNPVVDDLVAKARASLTVAESNRRLAEAEAVIVDDAPGVYTGSLRFIAMRSPRVQNYHLRCETGSYYDRMWV